MGRRVSSAPYPNTCLSYYTGRRTTAVGWGFRWVSLRTAGLPQHPVCWSLLVAREEHFLHAPRAKMRATVDFTSHKLSESLFVLKTFLANSTSL